MNTPPTDGVRIHAATLRDFTRRIFAAVPLPAADAVTVALYLRFLKRISSHARNLVSAIVNPFPRIGYKAKDEG